MYLAQKPLAHIMVSLLSLPLDRVLEKFVGAKFSTLWFADLQLTTVDHVCKQVLHHVCCLLIKPRVVKSRPRYLLEKLINRGNCKLTIVSVTSSI